MCECGEATNITIDLNVGAVSADVGLMSYRAARQSEQVGSIFNAVVLVMSWMTVLQI
jgi:hypothetical protein